MGVSRSKHLKSYDIMYEERKKNHGVLTKKRFGFAYIYKGKVQKIHGLSRSKDLDFNSE